MQTQEWSSGDYVHMQKTRRANTDPLLTFVGEVMHRRRVSTTVIGLPGR